MPCTFNIRSQFLPGSSSGGSWELVGYSTSPTGPFGSGGNWPWTSEASDDPSVTFDSLDQGYYRLNYFVGGVCGGQQPITIPIVGGGDAGVTTSVSACTSIINVATELGTTFDSGVLEATFNYSGSAVTSAGWIENNPNDPLDVQFDPTLVAEGTYTAVLSITPTAPNGYALASCCDPTTAILIITVVSSSVVIELQPNCRIGIVSTSGCSAATYELYKDTGAGFQPTGITTFPAQSDDNADWKVVATGCDCGTVDSNIVTTTQCCTGSTLLLDYDDSLCAMFVLGSLGCGGGQRRWYRSCDGGTNWELLPQYNGDSFIIGINDDCCYQYVVECPNGCIDRSNIECASCAGSCAGALAVSQNPCEYVVSGGPLCVGGTMRLKNSANGSIVATQTLTSYPVNFTITTDGTYFAELDCGNGCPVYTGAGLTFNGCGSGPSCDSVLTTSISSCVITASVTNCPNPIFTFTRPDGTTAQTSSSPTFTADQDGVWTITAAGCPNCPVLNDTITATGCAAATCTCSPTITETPCGQFSLSLSGCSGYTHIWQYRVNGASPWQTVQTGGTAYNGTANGQYRTLHTKASCPDETSNTITVTCFGANCNCVPQLNLNSTNCTLSASNTNCAGYTIILQRFTGSSWIDLVTNPSFPYTVPANSDGPYRLKATQTNCPDVFSNIVSVGCSNTGGCTVSIDSFTNEVTCGDIAASWTNSTGASVNISFAYPSVNVADCNNAGGWTNFTPTNLVIDQAANTLAATVDDPNICGRCIRLIVDDPTAGCTPVEERLLVPCCCTDTPSIDDVGNPVTYTIKVYDNLGNEDHTDPVHIDNEAVVNVSGVYKIFRNGVEVSSTPYDQPGAARLSFNRTRQNPNPALATGDHIKEFYAALNSATPVVVTIPTAPTTAVLSGAAGTVTAADITFDSSNHIVFRDSVKIVIENYLSSQGYDYDFITMNVSAGGNITYGMRSRHNPTANFVGTTRSSSPVAGNGGVYVVSGVEYPINSPVGASDKLEVSLVNVPTPCGNIQYFKESAAFPFDEGASDFNFHVMDDEDSMALTSGSGGTSASCTEYTLTVQNECTGATYVWNTGETTNSIIVSSGTYSVVITCPDGCTYTESTTV